ncbi:Bacteriophytochrome (light-regulated signal transduction histidine kinase) [Pedobacter antarcticus]|uniref:histidine kinase n=2 Tax=Pedobacter antarcticus TaxID=34086 RepID=A0A1I2ISI8_9SPHI|nr:Bacteriophytochrome (light-regulated signal transduction histidine kinase) [Pedobacter antarcticus]
MVNPKPDMTDFKVDLSNCASEPIHIPGQIQSHGFLIALDRQYKVSHCSDNIYELLRETYAKLIGSQLRYIEQLIRGDDQPGFIRDLLNIGKINKSFEQINPFKLAINGETYYLIISASADQYLLEFESSTSDALPDVQKMMGHSISKMLADKNLQSLLENTVLQVKKTILYDRVMIYRFAEDGHGEVVAEAKNEELSPWLGLHYPASDIPQQARDLYKLNLTRIIADVQTTPIKISAAADQDQPLELTYSQLRAVSPVHIQYLKNMGVASSFSISLLCKGELWGLIACHNYTPKFIDFLSRELSKLLGQILSSALEFRQEEIHQQTLEVFSGTLDKLTKQLQETASIEEALTKGPVTVLDIVHASGAVLVYEKNITKIGITPDDGQLTELISWLNQNNNQPLYHLTKLAAHYPAADNYRTVASGIMVVVISKELEEYVIYFKPEQPQFITWAGNPEKQAVMGGNGLMHISPRNSFQQWSQTILSTSLAWSPEEINSALRLQEEITYAINQKAGAIRLLNEQLQRAYDELDTFSYTVSHDLKNPIAAIKAYAQLVARSQGFTDRDRMLLGRINQRADQMHLMIVSILDYSRIGRSAFKYHNIDARALIEDIVRDQSLIYESQNVKITLGSMPELKGDPMMMLQIFSNLISNAVKYSKHGHAPHVHIEGTVNDADICYAIKDNGLGIAPHNLKNVFGLFSRMDNVKDIEGSGVGLAIVKRVVEKHNGRIWVESELNKGSVFFVSFNK